MIFAVSLALMKLFTAQKYIAISTYAETYISWQASGYSFSKTLKHSTSDVNRGGESSQALPATRAGVHGEEPRNETEW